MYPVPVHKMINLTIQGNFVGGKNATTPTTKNKKPIAKLVINSSRITSL